MDLIIDANILISALIAVKGKIYDLIFNDKIRLFSTEFLIEEIEKYKDEILTKSSITKDEFEIFLSLISSKIEFIPYSELKEFLLEAEKITPDINDREYFALALKLKCGIWSNDKRLKNQNKVKIYSTKDIINFLRL